MSFPAFPATIWTAVWHSWHQHSLRWGCFHLYLHRGIYWTIKSAAAPPRLQLAQQVRHQSRKQPRKWGSEPGAAASSMGLQVPSPLSAAWSLTCPGHAVMVQGLESCEQKRCWGFPFRPAASSERQVHLQKAHPIFTLKIHLEIMGEAQAGKTSMLAFSKTPPLSW